MVPLRWATLDELLGPFSLSRIIQTFISIVDSCEKELTRIPEILIIKNGDFLLHTGLSITGKKK